MTPAVDGVEFSRIWEAAWNRRDVETAPTHFDEDAVFTSPVAQRVGFGRAGVVRGKDALTPLLACPPEKTRTCDFECRPCIAASM